MNDTVYPLFSTHSVALATYLLLEGYSFTGIISDGSRGVFTIPGVPCSLVEQFENGKAKVDPKQFALKLSSLTQTAKHVAKQGR